MSHSLQSDKFMATYDFASILIGSPSELHPQTPVKHNEVAMEWLICGRLHFQLHVLERILLDFDSYLTELFLAATKQLYEWYFLSVCPSVRLSVCPSVCPSVTPFWLCSHHRIIMKFSGVITLDQGKVHAKGQGQRSKVKVTEVTTQIFVSGL